MQSEKYDSIKWVYKSRNALCENMINAWWNLKFYLASALCSTNQVKDILTALESCKINEEVNIVINYICPNHYRTQRNDSLVQAWSLRKALSKIGHIYSESMEFISDNLSIEKLIWRQHIFFLAF